MTHLVQTLNNYYLLTLGTSIVDGFRKLFQSMIASFEKQGIRRAIQELRKYSSYRDTYDQLSRLTDKELNDIGLSRGMIHSVSLEAYTDNLIGKKG